MFCVWVVEHIKVDDNRIGDLGIKLLFNKLRRYARLAELNLGAVGCECREEHDRV